eukprot:Pgem_evm1s16057
MPYEHQDFFSRLYKDDAFAFKMAKIYSEVLNRYGKLIDLIENGHIDPNDMKPLEILNSDIVNALENYQHS